MHPWSIALILQISGFLTNGAPVEKAAQQAVKDCAVHTLAVSKGTYIISMAPGTNEANTTGQLTIFDAQHLPVRILPVLFTGKEQTRTIHLQGLDAGKYFLHLSGAAQASEELEISVE